jgi:hypothetical protein
MLHHVEMCARSRRRAHTATVLMLRSGQLLLLVVVLLLLNSPREVDAATNIPAAATGAREARACLLKTFNTTGANRERRVRGWRTHQHVCCAAAQPVRVSAVLQPYQSECQSSESSCRPTAAFSSVTRHLPADAQECGDTVHLTKL